MKDEDVQKLRTTWYGKSAKGKVIHITSQGKAKCDNTIKNILIDKKLSIKDVSCAKCKRYRVYKEAMSAAAKEVVKKEVVKKEVVKKEVVKKEAKTPEPKTVGIKAHKKKPKQKEVKKEVKKEVVKDQKQVKPGSSFTIKSTMRDGKENIRIVHKATGKTFFDHIDRKVVYDTIKNLNQISENWSSETEPMPKNFIKKCRTALRKAYEICEIKVPKGLRKSKDGIPKHYKKKKKDKRKIKRRAIKTTKPKKVIKRRKKKAQPVVKKVGKVIKRRAKKKANPTNKHVEELIHQKITDGSVFTELTDALKSQFGLEIDQAKTAIEQTVLIMSRKLGIPVFIALGKTKESDFYSL